MITKMDKVDGHQWLTPVILATWEAKMERIKVQGLNPTSKMTTAK
jgi:hypothetical protein